jgi:hypothetical protein
MAGPTARKAVEYFFAEIAQLPDGTYYVSLTATSIDDEEQSSGASRSRMETVPNA